MAVLVVAAAAPRPSLGRRVAIRAASVCAIGLAAVTTFCGFSGHLADEAFANVAGIAEPRRIAGHYVIVEPDQVPRGLVCREAYGEQGEREEWNPLPQWRGEKSYHPMRELQADGNRQWYHFDAEGKSLGHLAQAIALTLRGKDSPLYDPIRDVGSFVVVTNCEKVRVSGQKYHCKLYFRNLSKRPGHMQVERFKQLQKRFPERIIMRAVWGMMPKTKSCRRIFKDRLKLFMGPNHLYYHEDPVEYPMHTIKDVTHSQNLRKKDRIMHFYTKANPRLMAKRDAKKQALYKMRLAQYKEFLTEELARDPSAADLSLEELKAKAIEDRYERTYWDAGGPEAKIVKPEGRVWIGTNIPRRKIEGNRRPLR